jgi:hypothetical protein
VAFEGLKCLAVDRFHVPGDGRCPVDLEISLVNANEPGCSAPELSNVTRRLGPRWFLVRNVHASPSLVLLEPRWALSFLCGPMTLGDIRQVLGKGGRREWVA